MRLSHPTKWSEVSPVQMELIGRMIAGAVNDRKALRIFLNTTSGIVNKLRGFQNYKLGELLSFINETQPLDYFIINKLKDYKAPLPKLDDVTFAEFIYIDTFFIDYSAKETPETLEQFIACLYVKHMNNARPVFTKVPCTKWVKGLKPWQIKTAVINYSLVRTWIEEAYPEVFAKKTDEPKSKKQSNGWVDVFDGIVGDDFKDSDQYANKPITETLRFLSKKIKENRKRKLNRKK